MAPRSTTPTHRVPQGFLIVFFILAFDSAQLAMAQWHCNGRAAVTMPAAGCSGVSVCSPLMVAVTQTSNWWNSTNNTAGNSLGVASVTFFTTFAYTPLLAYTNQNTYNGKDYSTACKKIAAIVNQVLLWANKTQANWTLANATYGATAKQELYGTVIPGWGYTIGQYIACGTSCVNYTSTTSTTTTSTSTSTTTSSSTTTPTTTTSSTTTPTTTSTSTTTPQPSSTTTTTTPTVCTPPVNTSGVIYVHPYNNDFSIHDTPSGSCACSSPYAQQFYMPGLNTPQSSQGPLTQPFVPSRVYSLYDRCQSQTYVTNLLATVCLCSPNGSCYNEINSHLGGNIYNHLTSWCVSGVCHSYVTRCYNEDLTLLDAVTGQLAYNCSAINSASDTAGSLDACPGVGCPFPIVDYILCGNCSSNGLKPQIICDSAFNAPCSGAPDVYTACDLVITEPVNGSGLNFPTFNKTLVNGTCGGCASADETDYYFPQTLPKLYFSCRNGVTGEPDWSELCLCKFNGDCYHLALAPGANGSLSTLVDFMSILMEAIGASCWSETVIQCAGAGVQILDQSGNLYDECTQSSTHTDSLFGVTSFRCNGGCPSEKPLDTHCPGPFVAGPPPSS